MKLWLLLPEISTRVFSLSSSQLLGSFKKLNEELKELVKTPKVCVTKDSHIVIALEEWRGMYELVGRFIDNNISNNFWFILFIDLTLLFSTSIYFLYKFFQLIFRHSYTWLLTVKYDVNNILSNVNFKLLHDLE